MWIALLLGSITNETIQNLDCNKQRNGWKKETKMRRCQFNSITKPGPQSCDRYCRSDVADHTGHIVAFRQNRPEIRTVLLPLSAAGETYQMDRAVAFLKRINGVSGACLFFNRTALRIYYHPDQTNINQILEALRVLKPDRRDYHNLETGLPRTAICG